MSLNDTNDQAETLRKMKTNGNTDSVRVISVTSGKGGVGKTTVMQKAAKGMDIQFVTFGTVMIDIAKEMKLLRWRFLPAIEKS